MLENHQISHLQSPALMHALRVIEIWMVSSCKSTALIYVEQLWQGGCLTGLVFPCWYLVCTHCTYH